MKTNPILILAAASLFPVSPFAQTAPPAPPAPPNPPSPAVAPNAPGDPRDRDRGPKVPVTFLGVETSSVPTVVSEQLGLAKGFGLVVDYVVPDGPAASAGVQQNDILKMLNDQILMEPDQLAKLVRSFPEGTGVTLTILRKGAESKVTAKLGKREVSARKRFGNLFNKHGDHDEHTFGQNFNDLNGTIHEAVEKARREAMRAAEEAERATDHLRIFSSDDGALKSTRIDISKAQVVYSDDRGEMRVATVDGKKVLTAKDAQGKLLFSGPVSSEEELSKVPAEVRQRYEKLEQKDLPAVIPPDEGDADEDAAEEDDDAEEAVQGSMQQVSMRPFSPLLFWTMNGVLI